MRKSRDPHSSQTGARPTATDLPRANNAGVMERTLLERRTQPIKAKRANVATRRAYTALQRYYGVCGTGRQRKRARQALTMNAAICSLSAVGRSTMVSRIWMRVLASM